MCCCFRPTLYLLLQLLDARNQLLLGPFLVAFGHGFSNGRRSVCPQEAQRDPGKIVEAAARAEETVQGLLQFGKGTGVGQRGE